MGVEEDKVCKPYRPLASGRISLESGQALYYFVIAISISLSIYNGLTLVSLVYFTATWFYNEYGLSANPMAKSPIGAMGYMCYCCGTTYIIGRSLSSIYGIAYRSNIGTDRTSPTSEHYIHERHIG